MPISAALMLSFTFVFAGLAGINQAYIELDGVEKDERLLLKLKESLDVV
jgi:hypothetical protein